MRINRSPLFSKLISDKQLIDLVRAGCRALKLKKYPHEIWFGISNRGSYGMYYNDTFRRDVKYKNVRIKNTRSFKRIAHCSKWRQTPGGYIEIWLPVYSVESWMKHIKGTWHTLKHELGHFKDIGILGNGTRHAKYSRHDLRPEEQRAENIALNTPDWKIASKEFMSIGLSLEGRKEVK
jgi:hypothetical protein